MRRIIVVEINIKGKMNKVQNVHVKIGNCIGILIYWLNM